MNDMDIRLLCLSLLRSRKHGATCQKNIRHSIPFYNTRTWTRTWTWANATCSKGGVQNDLAISDTFGLHHDAESPPPDFCMPIRALDVITRECPVMAVARGLAAAAGTVMQAGYLCWTNGPQCGILTSAMGRPQTPEGGQQRVRGRGHGCSRNHAPWSSSIM